MQTTVSSSQSMRKRGDVAAESSRPRRMWYPPAKAVFDTAAAAILVVCSLPLFALLALVVKLTSSGPVFYRQRRVGKGGRIFLMHKFRTMRHRCEDETGPVWSQPHDTRVTPVGRVLRGTHLDELPQLLNVLQGHMSLIGPRPERPELIEKIEQELPRFRERLHVRPGLTGLAQVRLPADFAMHSVRRKLGHDLYYVREVNPWLDFQIALSTVLYLSGVALYIVGRRLVNRYGTAAEYDTETGELLNDPAKPGAPGTYGHEMSLHL